MKNDVDQAVHAASLSIDKKQLSKGIYALDATTTGSNAEDMFYAYLKMNMKLDSDNTALSSSFLQTGEKVYVDELDYVNTHAGTIQSLTGNPTHCSLGTGNHILCSETLTVSSQTIRRKVDQMLVGPAIIAVVHTTGREIGHWGNYTYFVPAVQEVLFHS